MKQKENKCINVIYATDDVFAKYTAVSIKSLICNTQNFINIFVIGNLNNYTKTGISKLERGNHCTITFVPFDITLLNPFKDIKINSHLSITTYCRLLAHILLPNLSKAIYIDSDTIVLDDISDLYNVEMEDKIFAGSEDFASEYFKKRFNIPMQAPYINCGIIRIELEKLRKFDALTQMIDFAKKNAALIQTGDQDIINGTFYNKIKIISYRYNFYHEHFAQKKKFTPNNQVDYENSKAHPAIIHFVGAIKPWHINKLKELEHKYTSEFWQYARMTPFYEEIIYQNYTQSPTTNAQLVRDALLYTQNKFKYWKYKLLSKITFGKRRKKYKQKRKDLKSRLKQVNRFLKGK